MRTVTRAGLAVGAAFVLALAPAGQALAASGTFAYVGDNGEQLSLDNPVDGECYLLVSGARWVGNFTDTNAFVYTEHGCEGPTMLVPPSAAGEFSDPIPHSVTFG